MSLGLYIIGGFCLSFCIATSLHILKPKQWGDISKAFRWRLEYYFPVIVFPLVAIAVRIVLILKYDAVQPFDGLHCDATHPLWVRVGNNVFPALFMLAPTSCMSIYSTRHVIRTLRHVQRARRDENEIPRQMRRERQSGHHSFKQSGPVVHDRDDAPSSGRQPIDPALPVKVESTRRLSFHLPFFRNLQSISQTLTPPPSSPNPSPGPYDDGRASVASSSFPTFAPVIDKPHLYPNRQPNENDIADGSRTWIEDSEDSCAPTSLEGHDTSEALELDVKNQDDDDGTFRLSYRENANTPSRISHLAYIPLSTPQIRQLLICQIFFPISILITVIIIIVEAITHREGPRPINTQDAVQLIHAWLGAIAFGSSRTIRIEIVSGLAFWKR